MKLSIIMPVYNSEKYLERAVNCVLNQTFRDFELIMVDDGSTDLSPQICDRLSLIDKRIVVIHQKNKGIGGARNAGLRVSKGEYIGFMDNDDLIHPQMFEILMCFAYKENADIVMFREKWVNEDWVVPDVRYDISAIKYECKSSSYMYKNMFSESNLDTSYVTIWNKVYKRAIADKICFPTYGTEDTVFNCLAYSFSKVNVVLNLEPDLYYWVQRKTSTSHNDFSEYHCMSLRSYFDMEKYIYENSNENHVYILDKTFKKILSFRFSSRHTKFEKKTKEIIKKFSHDFLKRFGKCQEISIFKKLIYYNFYYFPFFYSCFRMINDFKARHFN